MRNIKKELTWIYDRLYGYFGPQRWWPADTPLEVMVGAVLTQNTNWRNVEKAILNLKRAGLLISPEKLVKEPAAKLAGLIRPAGYYNVKTKRLKNYLRYYLKECSRAGGEVPSSTVPISREGLLSVSGIGPETADSILLYAFEKPEFVVDAYTKRIFSRHGFFSKDPVYDDVKQLFQDNLPTDSRLFNEYHALIVRLGKEFCGTRPKCDGCPIAKHKISCK